MSALPADFDPSVGMVPGHDAHGRPDPIETAQRVAQMVRLKTAGASYAQIAEQVGYSDRHTVQKIIKNALDDYTGERIAEYRQVENARLDLIVQQVTAIMLDRTQTSSDRIKAANTLVSTSARRARLNGLDAPVRVEVTEDLRSDALAALDALRTVVGTVTERHDEQPD